MIHHDVSPDLQVWGKFFILDGQRFVDDAPPFDLFGVGEGTVHLLYLSLE